MDIIVYVVGFVFGYEFDGNYVDVIICEGFCIVYDISFYSFVVFVKVVCGMLYEGSLLFIFSYLGVEWVL